ncbi:MAG: metal ABC transporter substrate-binding protein [Treponema sp.]|jgi:zinc transport system substrate-binding protein|nr:metal ABC transporter substrate-binding protein [Treponema sp.]
MKQSVKQLLVVIAITLSMVNGVYARGRSDAPSQDARLTVVSTIFPPYDFVRELAGERVNRFMLVPPGVESHSFEPTPRDIIRIQNCDVFIYVGGDSDAWVERVLSSIDTSKMQIISLMDCVTVVEEELVEGMEEEEGEEEAEYDEHVWTAPRNAALIVQKLRDALCAVDAGNADAYRANAAAYLAKLDALDAAFREAVAGGSRHTIVFGDRFPFRYLADAYSLSYFAAFPGCSTETEASAATLRFLIDKVRAERIPVIFHIELSNERMADMISEETGAKKLLLHAGHNVSKRELEQGRSYLDIMNQNVLNLKEALR